MTRPRTKAIVKMVPLTKSEIESLLSQRKDRDLVNADRKLRRTFAEIEWQERYDCGETL